MDAGVSVRDLVSGEDSSSEVLPGARRRPSGALQSTKQPNQLSLPPRNVAVHFFAKLD